MLNQGGGGGGFRNRINNLAERFRRAGATSAETAKTPEEIGLPPQFYQAMHRRLGQTGIFVEVTGKYYLDETRLAQFNQSGFGWQGRQRMGRGGGQNYQARQSLLTLRIIRITLSIVVLLLIIGNFVYFHSFYTWIAIIFLFILTIVISVIQIFYLSRLRRNRNF